MTISTIFSVEKIAMNIFKPLGRAAERLKRNWRRHLEHCAAPAHLSRSFRHALSKLRLNDFAVGHDGCNRCLLSPFSSRTSRNQPSNKEFIFGPRVWLRCLIQPKSGWGLAYIDWSQQEIEIAAALSNDSAMKEPYESGDFYLSFKTSESGAGPRNERNARTGP